MIGNSSILRFLKLLENKIEMAGSASPPGSSGFIFVRPLGGGQDDWPRLMGTILPAAIALGQTVYMLPGLLGEHWLCNTVVTVPNGANILVSSEAVIDGGPALGIGAYDAVFSLANAVTSGALTPLAVDVLYGQTSITSPVSFPVGTNVFLSAMGAGANLGMQYTVAAVAGAGPFTLTFDRPVIFTGFTVANTASISELITRTENIHIDGQNALITTASSGAIIALEIGYRCTVKNFRLEAVDGGAPLAINSDTGNFGNVLTGYEILGPMLTTGGSISTNEGTIVEAFISQVAGLGFEFITSSDCTFRGKITGCGGDGLDLSGSTTCTVTGDFSANAAGIGITAGYYGNLLIDVTAIGNRDSGIAIANTPGVPIVNGTQLVGVRTSSNTNQGIAIGAGVKGTVATNLTTENELEGLSLFDDLTVYGWRTFNCFQDFTTVGDATTRLDVTGYVGSVNRSIGNLQGAQRVSMSGSVSAVGAAFPVLFHMEGAPGDLTLHDFRFGGPNIASCAGVHLGNATAALHIGDGVDWGGILVQFRIVATSPLPQTNSGQVDAGSTKAAWGAATSLTAAAAQNVPPGGGGATTSTTDTVGVPMSSQTNLTQMTVAFVGNALNVAGQTVTIQLLDNGAPILNAAVTLPTTAGLHQGTFWYGPTPAALTDVIRCTATPSDALTAAITDLQITTS
jgi:hypothetical protein